MFYAFSFNDFADILPIFELEMKNLSIFLLGHQKNNLATKSEVVGVNFD